MPVKSQKVPVTKFKKSCVMGTLGCRKKKKTLIYPSALTVLQKTNNLAHWLVVHRKPGNQQARYLVISQSSSSNFLKRINRKKKVQLFFYLFISCLFTPHEQNCETST